MVRSILKCIRTIDEFNLDEYIRLNIGVEIQDFTEPNLNREEVQDLVRRYKLLFRNHVGIKSMHGPFLDLKPSSPDPDIRQVSYNKYLNALRIAAELEMDFIVFHSQINPYLNDPFMMDLNNLQARDFWHEIMDEVSDFKGTVLIENIFEEEPELILERVQKIGLPNVKINFDIGHARLGSVSIEKWIKELRDYIVYVHLHSNNGIRDEHHVPTDIELMALNNLFKKYELDPVISLEYKTDDPSREIEILRR